MTLDHSRSGPSRPAARNYPFAALVGQDDLKTALLLNAISPEIGGVLIRGERGTAKSTAARALADLLPPLVVQQGCPCNSAPGDPRPDWPVPDWPASDPKAPDGELGASPSTDRPVVQVPPPFVELPLGATEDRVVGTLDFEKALQAGNRVFQPGLLASANRGILYVDEINLLPDHLADLLLDAAASGRNVVQREGVEVVHPARFQLIGTMNPEEGNLRPQLLDRFGLIVEVRGFDDPVIRMEVVRRRMAFETDPQGFAERWESEQQSLRQRIADARALLAGVDVPHEVLRMISELCCRAGVDGLRPDITIYKVARALAAFEGRPSATSDDVEAAAEFVLPFRRRSPGGPARNSPPQFGPPRSESSGNGNRDQRPNAVDSGQEAGTAPEASSENGTVNGDSTNPASSDPSSNPAASDPADLLGKVFSAASGGPVRPIRIESRGTVQRAAPGRRGASSIGPASRGQYVRAVADPAATDVAIAATLRSAAIRGKGENGRLTIQPSDLHRKERQSRLGTLILFVVDSSASMGARRRMAAVKGAVLSLLTDAYQQRDRVAVIAFRGERADLLLPPCQSIDLAREALHALPTGGRTPLAHALSLASETLEQERRGNPDRPVLVVVLTDGKANVALPDRDGDGWSQSLQAAAQLAAANISILVLDTEDDYVRHQRARRLADALAAHYLPLRDLTSESLVLEINRSRGRGPLVPQSGADQ